MSDTEIIDNPQLARFIYLAAMGQLRGASSGERAAFKLARTIAECAEHIDDEALNGILEFALGAQLEPNRALSLIGAKPA